MIQRIDLTTSFPTSIDTTKYTYNAIGIVVQSMKGKPNNYHKVSSYIYNGELNLVNIFTTRYHNATLIEYTTKETFGNYDHAVNSAKNLFLFSETFYRSLSQNNFMHYDRFQYDADNNLTASENRDWNIQYDVSGNIVF